MIRCALVIVLCGILFCPFSAAAQQFGSIRGIVYDRDFEVPLAGAQILIAETGVTTLTGDGGNFVFGQVEPGTYTLVISKDGYTRQVAADVVVTAAQLAELEAELSGEFTEMEEFVAQDMQLGGGSEAGLLMLRVESPSLLDSVSAELISKAGASDAASALTLVSGATVQDGKFAVVRGLPDRYVNSQMNGVRLPTADVDKRAVQLDQFASAVIESIQVSKTFTPDQQGDASGGAVNVVLKGIPEEKILSLTVGAGANSQVIGNDDFLTYKGGGVNFSAKDDGSRDIPVHIPAADGTDDTASVGGDVEEYIPVNWPGAVGVSRYKDLQTGAPNLDYNMALAAGGKREFWDSFKVGGFGSFYYKQDRSFYDDGINDSYYAERITDAESPAYDFVPYISQGSVTHGDFLTKLFDIEKASQEVQWGGLATAGIETENHLLKVLYMYTRVAEDTAILAENIRGKEYYFPGYTPDFYPHPGNQNPDASPYLRTETLVYTERVTETFQWGGKHTLPFPELDAGDLFTVLPPEFDWTFAESLADLYEPDKRLFGSKWKPAVPPREISGYEIPGVPAVYTPFKPAANFTIGNLQRVWKDIEEDSDQLFWNLKFPFEQWNGEKGYAKYGIFRDTVTRRYNQDSFSNLNNNASSDGEWEEFWSSWYATEDHPISPTDIDVDYRGYQRITAGYYMVDFPVSPLLRFMGGLRRERTELSIVNDPEKDVQWVPPGAGFPVRLNPGDADVFFTRKDDLPAYSFEFTPHEQVSLRGSYAETVARQTFKELTPIQQQEFLGGDVFIGNPELQMSELRNYDLRLDYKPYSGGLVSVSWFEKKIHLPIEYVQDNAGFDYTHPVNYPEGELSGYEIELRQQLGYFWEPLEGLAVGGNVTIIQAEVTLPQEISEAFGELNITRRDMTNAPEHLYNAYLTYDIESWGTSFGVFYTVRGDTLIAGMDGEERGFVPSIYEKEYDTLNISLSQRIGSGGKLSFKVKNILNPEIQEVYRSEYIGSDVVRKSYTKGVDYSLSLGMSW